MEFLFPLSPSPSSSILPRARMVSGLSTTVCRLRVPLPLPSTAAPASARAPAPAGLFTWTALCLGVGLLGESVEWGALQGLRDHAPQGTSVYTLSCERAAASFFSDCSRCCCCCCSCCWHWWVKRLALIHSHRWTSQSVEIGTPSTAQ